MSRRRVIEEWELGIFFDVPVLRGYVDGERVTVPWLWWANQRFGVSRSERVPGRYGTEEVLKAGTPAPTVFAHLEEP